MSQYSSLYITICITSGLVFGGFSHAKETELPSIFEKRIMHGAAVNATIVTHYVCGKDSAKKVIQDTEIYYYFLNLGIIEEEFDSEKIEKLSSKLYCDKGQVSLKNIHPHR